MPSCKIWTKNNLLMPVMKYVFDIFRFGRFFMLKITR